MLTHLQYGGGELGVEIPSDDVTVLTPKPEPGLADERAACLEAVRSPIGARPL